MSLRPGAVRLKGHYLGRESDHCLHLPDRVWEVRSQPGSTGTIRWGNLGAASYQGRAAASAPTYSQAVTGSEGHLFLSTGTRRGERPLAALPSGFSVGIWPEQSGHPSSERLPTVATLASFGYGEAAFIYSVGRGIRLLQQPTQGEGRKERSRGPPSSCLPSSHLPGPSPPAGSASSRLRHLSREGAWDEGLLRVSWILTAYFCR